MKKSTFFAKTQKKICMLLHTVATRTFLKNIEWNVKQLKEMCQDLKK